MRFLRVIVPAVFILMAGACLNAQVAVFPTRVIIKGQDRSGEVLVTNPTDKAMEVTASFGYKLSHSDSLGGMTLDTTVLTDEERAKSCQNWLKIFPRKFTLQPKGSRSVRVMASSPAGTEDGEYWGRLNFLTQPLERPQVVALDTGTAINMKATMLLAINIPVIYRKGKVETGLAIEKVQAGADTAGLRVLVDMRRLGNSAYRGTLTARLLRADGSELAMKELPMSAEFTVRRAVQLPPPPDGSYTLEVDVASVRKGSAADAVIPAPPIRKIYTLTVAGADVRVVSKE